MTTFLFIKEYKSWAILKRERQRWVRFLPLFDFFSLVSFSIFYVFDDAVNITSELHDLRTLVTIPVQKREKT